MSLHVQRQEIPKVTTVKRQGLNMNRDRNMKIELELQAWTWASYVVQAFFKALHACMHQTLLQDERYYLHSIEETQAPSRSFA